MLSYNPRTLKVAGESGFQDHPQLQRKFKNSLYLQRKKKLPTTSYLKSQVCTICWH